MLLARRRRTTLDCDATAAGPKGSGGAAPVSLFADFAKWRDALCRVRATATTKRGPPHSWTSGHDEAWPYGPGV